MFIFLKTNLSFFLLYCTVCCASYESSYLKECMLKHIDRDKVKFIVELGGYNFDDTLLLFDAYNCPIVTFEPNIDLVNANIYKINENPQITLVRMGAWDKTTILDFHVCPSEQGASSFYRFDYASLGEFNHESAAKTEERYPMRSHKVPVIKLDDWLASNHFDHIDLLCMDVQGAALNVLKGLSDHLHKVKYIITEVEYHRIYEHEALFDEIELFMKVHGFTCFNKENRSLSFDDVIFVRNDLIKESSIQVAATN